MLVDMSSGSSGAASNCSKAVSKDVNIREDTTKAVEKATVTQALLKEGNMFVADCHCHDCAGKIVFIQTDGMYSISGVLQAKNINLLTVKCLMRYYLLISYYVISGYQYYCI